MSLDAHIPILLIAALLAALGFALRSLAVVLVACGQRQAQESEVSPPQGLGAVSSPQVGAPTADLPALVEAARAERIRLEAVVDEARRRTSGVPQTTLDLLESLAEAAALEDPERLAQVAGRLPSLPAGVAADLFEADRGLLEVSRLAEKGLAPSEIASRLAMPLGEVELRLSLASTVRRAGT